MCEYSVSRLRGVLCCRTPGNYDSVWVSTCTLDGCIVFHPLFLATVEHGEDSYPELFKNGQDITLISRRKSCFLL
jgi:hypothetical protein